MSVKTLLLSSTLLAATFAAAPVFAQTAAPLPTTAADPNATAVTEVIVTGSRIKRTVYTSADPIQVISSAEGILRGVSDTGSLLQSSVIATGSPQVTPGISSALVTDGGPGSSTISLRGLGANRTLVLLNGRRAGPAGTRGGVSAFDLNVIPESAIDKIEILKDGASSIYGSDAVAGVVNIITKKDTQGFEVDAFSSIPEGKGGTEFNFAGTWGKTFDRGYLSVNLDYYKKNELRVGQRDSTNCGAQYRFNAVNGIRADVVDPRTGSYQCRDLLYDQVWLYDFAGRGRAGKLQYDYGGNLGKFIPKVPAALASQYPTSPDGYYLVGYDDPSLAVADYNSPFNLKSTLEPRVERSTIYAQGGYDITDNIHAYSEILINRRSSKSDSYRQFWTYLYTADDGDPFSEGFGGDYILSPTIATDHADNGQKVEYMRGVFGLNGEFTSNFMHGWTWDAFVQLSHNRGEYSQDVILADSVYSSDGRSDFGTGGLFNANSLPRDTASCAGLTTPISHKSCVDVSWLSPDFLAGKLTPAEEAFLFDSETGVTIYKQGSFEGSLSGDLFTLPAGPVGAALGVSYRKDEIKDTPGGITLAGNSWGLSSSGVTQGDDSTKEAFGELAVPLLKNYPLIDSLDLSLSGRYTDVSSYGHGSTYKAGLNWQITPAIRLRATKGTSFRAPALFELYLADQTDFLSQRNLDPCINFAQNIAQGTIPQLIADNCAKAGIPGDFSGSGSSATITTGGGFGRLKAEKSDSMNYGLTFTPKFADLQVAINYFDITVNNEVRQLGAANIVFQCYNSLNFPTDSLCSLFTRDPKSLLIDTVSDSYINVAEQKNRGIDLDATYAHDFIFDSKLTFNLQSTWQLKDTVALFAGEVEDENGFVGDPDWTGKFSTAFERGDWSAYWSIDMVGKASDAEALSDISADGLYQYKVHTEFTAYHTFSIAKKVGDDATIVLGVNNLFNEQPPSVTPGIGVGRYSEGQKGDAAYSSQYDYIGRRLFLNIRSKF